MRKVARRRRYVGRPAVIASRPLFRYSAMRDAYVLRGVGDRFGPVLRENRRHRKSPIAHADRRHPGAM